VYLSKTSGNLNPRGQQPQSNLQVSTVRSFEGGLNVTDTDLNMSPKYAKVLDNLERAIDGSLSIRPGTKLRSNQLTDATDIVNCYYFNNFIVTVQVSGEVSLGRQWHRHAAALLVQAVDGGSVEVSFTIFST
jgi:hypothetical protein